MKVKINYSQSLPGSKHYNLYGSWVSENVATRKEIDIVRNMYCGYYGMYITPIPVDENFRILLNSNCAFPHEKQQVDQFPENLHIYSADYGENQEISWITNIHSKYIVMTNRWHGKRKDRSYYVPFIVDDQTVKLLPIEFKQTPTGTRLCYVCASRLINRFSPDFTSVELSDIFWEVSKIDTSYVGPSRTLENTCKIVKYCQLLSRGRWLSTDGVRILELNDPHLPAHEVDPDFMNLIQKMDDSIPALFQKKADMIYQSNKAYKESVKSFVEGCGAQ